MATITAKIQLYVPESNIGSLELTMKAYRRACNWLSEKIFQTKELNQVKLNAL